MAAGYNFLTNNEKLNRKLESQFELCYDWFQIVVYWLRWSIKEILMAGFLLCSVFLRCFCGSGAHQNAEVTIESFKQGVSMPKLLIVGSNGFAGRYLKSELEEHEYDVYGVDLKSNDDRTIKADMLIPDCVDAVLEKVQPDGIFNLSGFASPHLSWSQVIQTMHLNVDISVNLALSMQKYCHNARLIVIGSANQYNVDACNNMPINELSPLKADDPYSVSKQAQEALLSMLASRNQLDIIITRSFNHIGPGQKKGFVVPDFASGIVNVERGLTKELEVGNLQVRRDFSDVRDIVRAYRLLYEKGHSGEVYNVGSGQDYQIRWILETLLSYSNATPRIKQRFPASTSNATNRMICDFSKLHEHTGYEPQFHIQETLREVLQHFRSL